MNEAFENAALALENIFIENIDEVEPEKKFRAEMTAEDEEALLYDWLEHLLYLFDAKSIVASKFKITKIEKTNGQFRLKAKIWGEDFSLSRHIPGTEVKAITYHMMEIKTEEDMKTLQVIVDI